MLGSRHLLEQHGPSRSRDTEPQLGKPLKGQVNMKDTVLS